MFICYSGARTMKVVDLTRTEKTCSVIIDVTSKGAYYFVSFVG